MLVTALALALWIFALARAAGAYAAEKGVEPDLTWGAPKSSLSQTSAAIKDVGARWVRMTVSWSWTEPTKGNYRQSALAAYDSAVQYSRDAGARIILEVEDAPDWAAASQSGESPPRNPADYGNFIHFLAARYAGRVAAYEVWNEENTPRFWSTGPDPAAYGQLLKAAYPAVKSADSGARVLFGGTARNDYTFLGQAYAAAPDLGRYFDVMATHPYPAGGASPEATWNDGGRISGFAFDGYREVRATMLAHGDDKPIWFTEFGWSTTSQPDGVGYGAAGEAVQADYLTKAYACLEQDPYVQVAVWYNLRNNYWASNADDWEDQLGLLRTDFSQKPAYGAFKRYSPGVAGCQYSQAGANAASTQSGSQRTATSVRVRKGRSARSSSTRGTRTRRAWRRVTVLGRVSGASNGRVTLDFRRLGRDHKWHRSMRVNRALTRGQFAKTLRIRSSGRWRVRGIFGGAGNAASSRSAFVGFRT